MDFGDNARMKACPPKFNPAAAKAGELPNIFRFRRAQHADAVVMQVAFVIEGSGIAIVACGMQFCRNEKARAVGESGGGSGSIYAGGGRPARHWVIIL